MQHAHEPLATLAAQLTQQWICTVADAALHLASNADSAPPDLQPIAAATVGVGGTGPPAPAPCPPPGAPASEPASHHQQRGGEASCSANGSKSGATMSESEAATAVAAARAVADGTRQHEVDYLVADACVAEHWLQERGFEMQAALLDRWDYEREWMNGWMDGWTALAQGCTKL